MDEKSWSEKSVDSVVYKVDALKREILRKIEGQYVGFNSVIIIYQSLVGKAIYHTSVLSDDSSTFSRI